MLKRLEVELWIIIMAFVHFCFFKFIFYSDFTASGLKSTPFQALWPKDSFVFTVDYSLRCRWNFSSGAEATGVTNMHRVTLPGKFLL
ncbi:hypothetical protein [Paenibacillus sp. P3E]|uniref:hypothetical protein n=1 Tax=Paenibacillus sp. P3E TaxID=1349435 RepID=UPI000A6330DC|nr:hypothetical protein [Paenibacillus sp. P3E]